jgi:hypothetical protein
MYCSTYSRSQSQCLVNVCGDVVQAVYGAESTGSDIVTVGMQQIASAIKGHSENRLSLPNTGPVAQKAMKEMQHSMTVMVHS